MARTILGLERGDKRQADHRNRITLDNTSLNLRIATRRQNQQNRGVQKNSSGYKGVGCKNGKYWSRITALGQRWFLGRFKTAVEAAKAYDKAAVSLFGEFALTNKMLGLYPKS